MVQPGGMADRGDSILNAQCNFRLAFRNILLDIASGSKNFKQFEKLVEAFFNATDGKDEEEWNKARDSIKSGKTMIPTELCFLKKESGAFDSKIKVILLDKNTKLGIKRNANLPKIDVTLPSYATAARDSIEMVSKGTAPLKQIFEMLDHCAKGYHAIEKTHNWWILYNGRMMMKRCAFLLSAKQFFRRSAGFWRPRRALMLFGNDYLKTIRLFSLQQRIMTQSLKQEKDPLVAHMGFQV